MTVIFWQQGKAVVFLTITVLASISLLLSSSTLGKLGFDASEVYRAFSSLSESSSKNHVYSNKTFELRGSNTTALNVPVQSRIEAPSAPGAITETITPIESKPKAPPGNETESNAMAKDNLTSVGEIVHVLDNGTNVDGTVLVVNNGTPVMSEALQTADNTRMDLNAIVTESSATSTASATVTTTTNQATAFKSNMTVTSKIFKLPALIADNVFMMDVVWVPSSSTIVMLAMTPKMFSLKKLNDQVFKRATYNHTFPYETLQSPIILTPHMTWNNQEIRTCNSIRAEADDGNINDRMYITECHVAQDNVTRGVLRYKDNVLAELDRSISKFNAGYQFDRDNSKSNSTKDKHTKVSIVVKPISHYSPFIPDLLDYYQKQGVQHVYLGLIHPSEELLNTFSRSLANFSDFVSLGWFESTDVSFNYAELEGQDYLKIMFANSVLWNAKAFQDDFLMVADLDEVLVSMNPTHTSFVEELGRTIDKKTTCDAVISPRILWRPNNLNSTRIGDRYPLRCSNEGIYEKSVAVLDNCNFVGLHIHKACRNNTSRKYMDPSKVTLHHYTSLWNGKVRYLCNGPNDTEVESELATFQRHGFVQ